MNRDPRFAELDRLIAGGRVRQTGKRRWCAWCGKILTRQRQRLYCCREHAFADKSSRVRIDKDRLGTLYLLKNLSLREIARAFSCSKDGVRVAMIRYGIPRRKHTQARVCIEPGCEKPAHKQRNPTNGRCSGRRCLWHQRLKRAEHDRNRRMRERENAVGPVAELALLGVRAQ